MADKEKLRNKEISHLQPPIDAKDQQLSSVETDGGKTMNEVELDSTLRSDSCTDDENSKNDVMGCKSSKGHSSKGFMCDLTEGSLDYFNHEKYNFSDGDPTSEFFTCTNCEGGESILSQNICVEDFVRDSLDTTTKKFTDSSELFTCDDCYESQTSSEASFAILELSRDFSDSALAVDSSEVFTCSSCHNHNEDTDVERNVHIFGIVDDKEPCHVMNKEQITHLKDEKKGIKCSHPVTSDGEIEDDTQEKEDIDYLDVSDDSKKDVDTSKAVTFAEDMEIYDMTSKSHIPITVSLDTPVHLIDQALALPQLELNVPSALAPKNEADSDSVDISERLTNSDLEDFSEVDRKHFPDIIDERPILVKRPSLLPLSSCTVEVSHDKPSQKEKDVVDVPEKIDANEDPSSTSHKSFLVVNVDEADLPLSDLKDKKPLLDDTPLRNEMSDRGSIGCSKSLSVDSIRHDTIGPLDNPAFLKSLQYAYSQPLEEEDENLCLQSNLDLCSINTLLPPPDLDQGWAWVVLVAAFVAQVILGGSVYCTGVLLSAIVEEIDTDLTAASWIGSVHVCVSSFTGPVAGVVVKRFGTRMTVCAGGVLATVGFLAASFCTTVGQLILTHGVIAGVGAGLTINSVFVCVGQYFCRYRAVACGLLATGAGTGMLSGGALMSVLLSRYGLSGAYMLWSSIVFHLTAVGLLLRPSPVERLYQQEKEMSTKLSASRVANQPECSSMASGINSLFGSINQSMLSGIDRTNQRYVNSRLASTTKSSQADPDLTLLKAVLHKEMSRSNSVLTTRSGQHQGPSPVQEVPPSKHSSVGGSQYLVNSNIHTGTSSPDAREFGTGKNFNSSNHLNTSSVTSKCNSLCNSSVGIDDNNGFINNWNNFVDDTNNSSVGNSHTNMSILIENFNSNWQHPASNRLQPSSQFVSSSTLAASSRHPLSSPASGTSRPRTRLLSTGSQYASTSHISARLSYQNNFMDNESVSSAMVSQLRPRDAIAPRHPLGSLSFSMMGSVASFPTSLALLKDDMSRFEHYTEPEQKKETVADYGIACLDSLRILRKKPFLVLLASNFLWAFGESPVMIYLATYAVSRGTDKMQASFLYTTMGIGSVCGRFLSGLASGDEDVGPVIIFMGCLGVSGLLVMILPLLTATVTQQMVFSCLLGVYTGALVPLNSLIFIELLGVGELGLGFGFLSMSQGTGYLIGPPLAGFIFGISGFSISFLFAGLTLLIGSVSSFFLVAFLSKSEDDCDEDTHPMDDLERALHRISNSGSFTDVNDGDNKEMVSDSKLLANVEDCSGVADACVSLDNVYKGATETAAKEDKDLDTILE